MIIGIGTDIIEIERVGKACETEAFFVRCFTEAEREFIKENKVKAAGNFAVKEAVSKTFGTGFRGFQLNEVEVLRDELGKPYVTLYGNALNLAQKLHIKTLHVSISNTKDYAIAYVVGESE